MTPTPDSLHPLLDTWTGALAERTRCAEGPWLQTLLPEAELEPARRQRAAQQAEALAVAVRERALESGRNGLVQGLLQQFALSSQEGVALMCLAEALLRIPDAATRDALIRDKIVAGDWQRHLGQSPSLFVNAATWGLLLSGKLVATHSDAGLTAALRRIVSRGGEPLVRTGVDLAMRLMGEQFVLGQTIGQALQAAQSREERGYRFSYDMLGEAALTEDDAHRYTAAYAEAIAAISTAAADRGPVAGPGISIKLSALHPRYSRAQVGRVHSELYPRLLALAEQAKAGDIGLNIDAEEADRLQLSLGLLERLARAPSLAGWSGLGFVVQAYQKRCPVVVDYIVALARATQRRLMVRLVKGAYWDSEIKRAQVDGLADYPVYTRKPHTDVAYLACARRLLAAPDAVFAQFATHNAYSLAAVLEMAREAGRGLQDFEAQCLHGMGEPLYDGVVRPVAEGGLGLPCRVYAPVGAHDTLLAYLVRRLLENGANSSFVHRVADPSLPIAELVEDPVATLRRQAEAEGSLGLPHPQIPRPDALFGRVRVPGLGLDLADEGVLAALDQALDAALHEAAAGHPARRAQPILATPTAGRSTPRPLHAPGDRRIVYGLGLDADAADCDAALAAATAAAAEWAARPAAERAACLDRAADTLQADLVRWTALLVLEAGKTRPNAIAEVREAIDFLRYYAAEWRAMTGTGPDAAHADAPVFAPLGPIVCISPWNFPLAIFTGQVAAALVTGNPVLAKPAEQTPLSATWAVQALHAAGVPRAVLQLLPGDGAQIGARLVADARVQGVVFTGSTEVARLIQRTLAQRLDARGAPVTLIAETGGLNALIVDSSALTEQVVQDAALSAFDSAGQRCSALRLLCVQREALPRVREMLLGALQQWRLGDPRALAVDVGPVIDEEARAGLAAHIDAMRAAGLPVATAARQDETVAQGSYVAPVVIELDRVGRLQREVFGPVLHLIGYGREDLDELLWQINARAYGLTGGIHTRIDESAVRVARGLQVGNLYVNRSIVGAVVGVQPFGGEGLSGTGPKAGGPLYLLRLLAQRPDAAAAQAVARAGPVRPVALRGWPLHPLAGNESGTAEAAEAARAWRALNEHAATHSPALAARMSAWEEGGEAAPPEFAWRRLAGPTGEHNAYGLLPRPLVACVADDDAARLGQLAAVLRVGARAAWPAAAAAQRAALPAAVQARIVLSHDWAAADQGVAAVLHSGSPESLRATLARAAATEGPLLPVLCALPDAAADAAALPAGTPAAARPGGRWPLERLLQERAVSINTAAAGGNASLMALV